MITITDGVAKFEGLINDTDAAELRQKLSDAAPAALEFDFSECTDVHMAIAQILVAYRIKYGATIIPTSERRLFIELLEGVRD